MLNLYPQRATNPDKLHKKFQPILHRENLHWIRHYLHKFSQESQVHVWCAWGTLIETRPYLLQCLSDIHDGIVAQLVLYWGLDQKMGTRIILISS